MIATTDATAAATPSPSSHSACAARTWGVIILSKRPSVRSSTIAYSRGWCDHRPARNVALFKPAIDVVNAVER